MQSTPRSTTLALPGAFALALILALIFGTGPAAAACDPTNPASDPTIFGVGFVEVGLIDTPFPGHSPTPDPARDTTRREHAYISSTLASTFGIRTSDIDADWRNPNPQIRVWIEKPASFRNFDEVDDGVAEYRDRKSSALFTVVGIVSDISDKIWVYEQENDDLDDTHSGEYKLFATDGHDANGDRVENVTTLPDADNDGMLDDVDARVYVTPPFSSTYNGTDVFTPICEPDADGYLSEFAERAGGNDFVLLVPHGKFIETRTSDQVAPIRTVVETNNGTPMNLWDVHGVWGDDQTSRRWHITSTNTDTDSWPALRRLIQNTTFYGTQPFRYALSLHGFGGSSGVAEVIVGGGAPRDVRCLVAKRIDDAVTALGASKSVTLTVPGPLNPAPHDGDSPDNIVNRMGAFGIQLEQSSTLRSHDEDLDGDGTKEQNVFVTPVAEGAADAIVELLALSDPVAGQDFPTAGNGYCAQFGY